MSNGIEIKTSEDWAKLYKSNPDIALSLLYQNISDIKAKCDCRYQSCQAEISRKTRSFKAKNMAMQTVGGIAGGVAAVWLYLKVFLTKAAN